METPSQKAVRITLSQGDLLRRRGEVEAARTLLEAASHAHPEATELPRQLAILLRDEGRFAEALAAVARLPQAEPAETLRKRRWKPPSTG